MASSKPPVRASAKKSATSGPSLRLTRTGAYGDDGIMLYYENAEGREETWLLEQTSIRELMALLLQGNVAKGGRMVVDSADVTIEPPQAPGGKPLICVASGPLESCVPLDVQALKALRGDIDRALKSSV